MNPELGVLSIQPNCFNQNSTYDIKVKVSMIDEQFLNTVKEISKLQESQIPRVEAIDSISFETTMKPFAGSCTIEPANDVQSRKRRSSALNPFTKCYESRFKPVNDQLDMIDIEDSFQTKVKSLDDCKNTCCIQNCTTLRYSETDQKCWLFANSPHTHGIATKLKNFTLVERFAVDPINQLSERIKLKCADWKTEEKNPKLRYQLTKISLSNSSKSKRSKRSESVEKIKPKLLSSSLSETSAPVLIATAGETILEFDVCNDELVSCTKGNQILIDVDPLTSSEKSTKVAGLLEEVDVLKHGSTSNIFPIITALSECQISAQQREDVSDLFLESIAQVPATSKNPFDLQAELKILEQLSDTGISKSSAGKITKKLALEIIDGESKTPVPPVLQEKMGNSMITLLKRSSNILVDAKALKEMTSKKQEGPADKRNRQESSDMTWFEQKYVDNKQKANLNKGFKNNAGNVTELADMAKRSLEKLSVKFVKDTCVGCPPKSIVSESGSLSVLKINHKAKDRKVATSDGLKIDLGKKLESSGPSNNQVETDGIDDPDALVEEPSEELNIEMKNNNDMVTENNDVLIGRTTRLSGIGETVKLQIPNNQNDIKKQRMNPMHESHPAINLKSTSHNSKNKTEEKGIPETMSISKFEVTPTQSGIIIVVEPDDYNNVEFAVYIKIGKEPEEVEYDLLFELPHKHLKVWDLDFESDIWKIFIPRETIEKISPNAMNLASPNSDKKIIKKEKNLYDASKQETQTKTEEKEKLPIDSVDTWYMGIVRTLLKNDQGSKMFASDAPAFANEEEEDGSLPSGYTISVVTPTCKIYDSIEKKWKQACSISEKSNLEFTECFCENLKTSGDFTLGTEFVTPPNTIDFASVFANFDVSDNPVVFSTIIVFLGIYVLVLILTCHLDKKDLEKWAIKGLVGNDPDAPVGYHVTISTGVILNSGTQSHCYIQFSNPDTNTKGKVHALKLSTGWIQFKRCSATGFIIRDENLLPDKKGTLQIKIWHDNSGKGENASWYIDQIMLKKIQPNSQPHHFIFKQWLAVDKGDGKISQ